MLSDAIKSYPYIEYMNDDNIRAFFDTYNAMSQEIYDWLRTANLPIFAGGYQSGDQLKWIAKGIYGQDFPIMVTGKTSTYGPYNTITFNQLPYNVLKKITVTDQITASDDIFKRIMTWNFYKGDGMHFTIPWLKRRIMRFLNGPEGVDIVNDQQYGVSVVFDTSGDLVITISQMTTNIIDSAMFGAVAYGSNMLGELQTETINNGDFRFANVLKQAFDNGLLHMPFWAKVTLQIIG